MMNFEPNRIQEYYIAYVDILGYKRFFEKYYEKVPEFLALINEAIQRTKNHLANTNQSPIMNVIGKIDIHSKVFSDNIFLCMETTNEKFEQIRILAFLQVVADIQRGFVNEYNLFVRGSIIKGEVSFNDDFVFGQGLIDAYQMEERAQYPRIVIDKQLITFLKEFSFCSKEDNEKYLQIEEKVNRKEKIDQEEQAFYSQMNLYAQLKKVYDNEVARLTLLWPDENWILCYLYMVNLQFLGEPFKERAFQMIQEISQYDYQRLQQPCQNYDMMLELHKIRVEKKLKEFGNNADIATGEVKEAELREKILKKYIWVMTFHNLICEYYKKQQYTIYTKCNCDVRFLKMIIEVQ